MESLCLSFFADLLDRRMILCCSRSGKAGRLSTTIGEPVTAAIVSTHSGIERSHRRNSNKQPLTYVERPAIAARALRPSSRSWAITGMLSRTRVPRPGRLTISTIASSP